MNFEIHGHKTYVTKGNCCNILGLAPVETSVNPNLVASTRIIRAYHQMGYNSDLTVLSKF